MRNSSNMPGWRSLASRYCCIIGVSDMVRGPWSVVGCYGLGTTDHGLFLAVAELAHDDRVALLVVEDFVHVVAHQHQAAAAGALEVLDRGRVGHVGWVEAGALVGDAHLEVFG